MSFHYILPSNTSPNVFPHNRASSYSTPIYDILSLSGHWEMALTSATVNTCINTFHNDIITLEESHDEQKTLRHITLEPYTFQEF